jgi:rhodanese-related sulfurtransferase
MTTAAPRIDAQSLKAIIDDNKELAIIDVREDGQFGLSHLLLAVSVPYSLLEARILPLVPRKATRMVLMDAGDGISDKAAARLAALGYSNISILDGGVESWGAAGFELFMGVSVPSKAFAEVVEHECGTPAISAQELQAMFDAGDDLVVLDSRTPAEFNRMRIPNGINCPGAELAYRVHDLVPSPDSLIVVNCAGRTRSIIGAQSLINAGVKNKVVSLRGGTQGWVLAGLDLDRGKTRGYGPVSPEGAQMAKTAAANVKTKFNVTSINHETLAAWKSEDRTLYLFDVRDEDAYKAGHIPGAVSAPGGQLVQAMDLKAATRNARVVLIDDTEIHATMTAHWLLQMGWDAYILEGGLGDAALETGMPAPESYVAPGDAAIETISPEGLADALKTGDAIAIDTDISLDYRAARLPGAHWCNRARLDHFIKTLPADKKIVLYSEHETRARTAINDVRALTDAPVVMLKGGREAWKQAGLPTEASPDAPKDEDCIDFLFWVHDRHLGNEDSMRGYLAWEEQLPAQIEADGGAQYRIIT